jgi:Uma2 family endonuclease
MFSPQRVTHLSVEEYLESEMRAPVKREYVAGQVFAMVGVSIRHNLITANLARLLGNHLEGGPCRVLFVDVKVRVEAADAFYYPDVMVTCVPENPESYYLTRPCLIAEVLSPSTEGIDRREKLIAYQSLPDLVEYVLIAQERPWVEVYRRESESEWWHEVHEAGGRFTLKSAACTLEVNALYRGVSS